MKRFGRSLLIFFILAVLFAAGTASLLPHSHEGDWDHSRHPDCPFYRLGHTRFTLPWFFVLVLFWICLEGGLLFSPFQRVNPSLREGPSTRAPPLPPSL